VFLPLLSIPCVIASADQHNATLSLPSAPSQQQAQTPAPGITTAKPQSATVAGAEVLTLEKALALARQNSPRLHGAAAASAHALAGVDTARAYTNPQIELFLGKQSARNIATPGVPGLLQHYAAYQTVESPSERRA
jgi:outer membrane protein, heavy metal efflux system